ncbi:hypothetical protein N7G274_006389 [Stereocaulon virgatum]|uniref:Uncharacterized protein n=1 Tax=Stereocaulon virgatum TaxID=373712 RepID=A0ABR4A6C9_9LECA
MGHPKHAMMRCMQDFPLGITAGLHDRQFLEAAQDVGFSSREHSFPGRLASYIVIEYNSDGKQLINGKSAQERLRRHCLTKVMQVAPLELAKAALALPRTSNSSQARAVEGQELKRLSDFIILQNEKLKLGRIFMVKKRERKGS